MTRLFETIIFVGLALLAGSVNANEANVASSRELGRGRSSRRGRDRKVNITVSNLAFQQPFSGIFVVVHDEDTAPLYELGKPASPGLANLAENGDTSELMEYYQNQPGVASVATIPGPIFGGKSVTFTVSFTRHSQYFSLATMAINTNDCFVAVNGARIVDGMVLDEPGMDAGSEENNELCTSIPGPACPADTGNVASGNGEGFVHVHRGFFGVTAGQENGLSESGYDWRNPMMRVSLDRV